MNKKLVRPVLAETNDLPKVGDVCKNKIELFIWTKEHTKQDVINTLVEYRDIKVYKLILISLDSNEEIDVTKQRYFQSNNDMIKTIVPPLLFIKTFGDYYNIMATQDKLPMDYIAKFVDEYNSNSVKDIEIGMEFTRELQAHNNILEGEQPVLSNGFVKIIESEPIGKPLEDYIKLKYSQERCLGFIDGYEAKKRENGLSYTEEEVEELCYSAFIDAIKSTGDGWNGEYADGNNPDVEEKFGKYAINWFEINKKL